MQAFLLSLSLYHTHAHTLLHDLNYVIYTKNITFFLILTCNKVPSVNKIIITFFAKQFFFLFRNKSAKNFAVATTEFIYVNSAPTTTTTTSIEFRSTKTTIRGV